jgi:hypothetical protein
MCADVPIIASISSGSPIIAYAVARCCSIDGASPAAPVGAGSVSVRVLANASVRGNIRDAVKVCQMIESTRIKRRAPLFVLLLSTVGVANAQMLQRTPLTETDLHASYCAEVIAKLDIPYYEQALVSLALPSGATSNPERDALVASMQNYLNTARATLRRLALYLAPRILNPNLDLIGLMGAKAAAAEDISRFASASASCLPECQNIDTSKSTVCMNECVARKMPDVDVIKKKVQACRNLSWLPI